jgi:hypothetical protein
VPAIKTKTRETNDFFYQNQLKKLPQKHQKANQHLQSLSDFFKINFTFKCTPAKKTSYSGAFHRDEGHPSLL